MRHPERLVATLNGLIVLLSPFVVATIARAFGAGVRPVRPASTIWATTRTVIVVVMFMLPLAAAAAWRSLVHAKRWHATHDWGWQGVLESAALGLVIGLCVLARAMFSRPIEAAPAWIFVGLLGAIVGAVAGLILLVSAHLVLTIVDKPDHA
jgi:hypothetical protein